MKRYAALVCSLGLLGPTFFVSHTKQKADIGMTAMFVSPEDETAVVEIEMGCSSLSKGKETAQIIFTGIENTAQHFNTVISCEDSRESSRSVKLQAFKVKAKTKIYYLTYHEGEQPTYDIFISLIVLPKSASGKIIYAPVVIERVP